MAAHTATPAEIAHEERRYIQVFVWLAVLTALEIGAHLHAAPPASRSASALVLLAASKAALVALYFMHLVHEKRTLTYIALTPAILCVFLVLMLLPDLGAITRLIATAIEHAGGRRGALSPRRRSARARAPGGRDWSSAAGATEPLPVLGDGPALQR